MRQISVKAFVASNVAWLVIALTIVVAAALQVLLVAWSLNGFPMDMKPIMDGLKTSSLFISSVAAIAVIPAAVAAGYLAGRIAKRGHVLNGSLSSCAWIVILIYVALEGGSSNEPFSTDPRAGPSMPALLQLVLVPGNPVFGALGGLLARHMEKRRAD
jgi:uncharacterized membrane protein